jgi:hypothetical protein
MSGHCEIIVKCQLDTEWSVWFEGLTITYDDKGHTLISGQLRDQAAFYGLLAKVRDLCLFLVSIKYMVDESIKPNDDSDNNS